MELAASHSRERYILMASWTSCDISKSTNTGKTPHYLLPTVTVAASIVNIHFSRQKIVQSLKAWLLSCLDCFAFGTTSTMTEPQLQREVLRTREDELVSFTGAWTDD
ncbi:uncharacterized protein RCC_03709 [Ramularia collo-cygni]|uniref:Uncharacterized protein n=1 Tax=Ramularia collo-cygni TaxID=112498 RepID=A0A2D3VBM1_9PEZI|nr:uncharacterized protein RCC_03709 [Ramularia collo-cygni]CZT17873.1 uncharacterized protein RCC_03709 [Ramularia collo-cygni]